MITMLYNIDCFYFHINKFLLFEGEMIEVIKFPPLSEGISDFFLVPTLPSENYFKERLFWSEDDSNPEDRSSMPALLLVSQSRVANDLDEHEYDDFNNDSRNQSPSRGTCESSSDMYDVGNKSKDDDTSSEVNFDNVQMSKGKELSLFPCPVGVTTIPTAASGATPVTIAVAIAVALTDSRSPKGSEGEGFGGSIMREFFPSGTMAKVTCINALPPCTILTSLAVVLSLPKEDDAASKILQRRNSPIVGLGPSQSSKVKDSSLSIPLVTTSVL
jgi:hypothetical protein